jgi:hypothetical protein
VGGGAPPPEAAEPEVTGATGGTGLELPALEPWLPPPPPLVLEPPAEPPPVVVTPVLPWPPLVLGLPPLAPPDPWVVVGPVPPEPLAWRDPGPPPLAGGELVVEGGSVVVGGSEVVGGVVELGGLVVVGGRVDFVVGGPVLLVVSRRFGAVVGGVAGAWARLEGGIVSLGLERVVGVPVVGGGSVDLGVVVVVETASAACLGAVSKPTMLPPIAPISTAARMLTHFRAATYRTGLKRRTPPVRAS